MSNEITENLVEQLAVVAYEDVQKRHLDDGLPSWAGSSPITRHKMKEETLRILNMLIPVLKEEGWLPPSLASKLRALASSEGTQAVQTTLMNDLNQNIVASGHNTQEGLNGYSEGVEHGTIIMGGRVLDALGDAK